MSRDVSKYYRFTVRLDVSASLMMHYTYYYYIKQLLKKMQPVTSLSEKRNKPFIIANHILHL